MKNRPANQSVYEIIRRLEKVTATGYQASQVFDDWLDLVHASLEALPEHFKNARQGKPLEDTPETQDFFSKVKVRYNRGEYWENFAGAFAILFESTSD